MGADHRLDPGIFKRILRVSCEGRNACQTVVKKQPKQPRTEPLKCVAQPMPTEQHTAAVLLCDSLQREWNMGVQQCDKFQLEYSRQNSIFQASVPFVLEDDKNELPLLSPMSAPQETLMTMYHLLCCSISFYTSTCNMDMNIQTKDELTATVTN